jgi:hypothetical protein
MQAPPSATSARSKTQRRRGPLTPAPESAGPFGSESVMKATEDSLDSLFAAESAASFAQSWQKLDKGGRLDRLRRFVQGYPDLSPAERASLLTAVLQAFELRQLNTKSAVEYDPSTATILSIRGLRDRVNPTTGLRAFRIDAAAATGSASSRTTQRRKGAGAGVISSLPSTSLNPSVTE